MLTLILAALFNTITLQQFGAVQNTNTPLQPTQRFNFNQPLRTNDFQPLQQRAATEWQPIRMGPFLIAQSPAGIGLSLPASQTVNTREVRIEADTNRLTIGAAQSTALNPVTNLYTSGLIPLDIPNATLPIPNRVTTQAIWVIYFLPGDSTAMSLPQNTRLDLLPNTMVDYNIIGNAYHDVRYNGLTPTIGLGGPEVVSITITNTAGNTLTVRPAGNESIPLLRGKLKFTLSNGQTWLLYVEESTFPLTLTLNATRTSFTATAPFTGVLRFAALQTTPPPPANTLTPLFPPVEEWSTAIYNQTYPASPIGMYLFWPVEWTRLAAAQIATNLAFRRDVPSCNLIPHLLPILARASFTTAQRYFLQLTSDQYDNTTNPFITYFMMLVASKQNGDILSYQSTYRPQAQPIPFSAIATEATFDTYRSAIPISSEVLFSSNTITWKYLTSSGAGSPLTLYPAYKTQTPITGFGYADPIKGPLNGVVATDRSLSFTEGAVPTWYPSSFFPSTLAFTTPELGTLLNLFSPLQASLEEGGVLSVGQQLTTLALTVRCALFALDQAGYAAITRERTKPFIDLIRTTLIAWLNPNTRGNNSDFFIGDSLTGGIVTFPGAQGRGASQASADENNALYSTHHIQYGHFLFAAATLIEWEERFRVPIPFLTLPITFASTTYIMKDLVDMLWRDARNPDLDDPQLPYNRHGNPWEGHSTENGSLYTLPQTGRNQELFGQDFWSWVGTTFYARAIRNSTQLTAAQKLGFDTLETFATTNTQLTATSGELIFRDNQWVYPPPFSTANTTVGNVFDTQVVADTTLDPGTPCQIIPIASPLIAP
ncbi:MAG: glycosyl hydrolase [Parachlamydiales bacterium]